MDARYEYVNRSLCTPNTQVQKDQNVPESMGYTILLAPNDHQGMNQLLWYEIRFLPTCISIKLDYKLDINTSTFCNALFTFVVKFLP